MTNVRRVSLWVLLCLTAAPLPAAAQIAPAEPPDAGPPPAHLTYTDGRVFLDREGRADEATVNMPLADGDRLRVENGRAEVMLPDGSLLHLDEQTVADALAPDLWRLLRGRVLLMVRRARDPQLTVRYQIDTPAASVRTGGPGEYRIWAGDGDRGRDVELAVSRGQATLANEFGAQDVQAGERSYASEGLAPSAPQYFNSARWDDFGRWSATRRDANLATASRQYLPDDLDVYASTFDRYGTWRADAAYGYVWYPAVAADWRPYSVGYWRQYPSWGSFWIGNDPWGWPTHHYGRWGFSLSFGWYWIPSTAWAPAWVYWAVSPGYVSWCALGYNNYPVYGHWGVHGAYDGRGYDPWHGWVVMPRHHFGAGMPVRRYAVDGRGLPPSERGAFVAQRPSPAGFAVPRSYASGTAVPRGSSGPVSSPGATPRAGGNERGAPSRSMATPRGGAGLDTARRVFSSEPPRAGAARTPGATPTPDTTAFQSRRNAVPRSQAAPSAPAGEPAENRYRARALPESMRSIFPPSGTPTPSTRQPGMAVPRDDRGPQYQAPRSQTPQYQAPRTQTPPPSGRSAPRSEPSSRSGQTSGRSSGTAAPRYNPGAAASRPRSGGSAPPTRRRGGAPDP